MAAIQSLTQLPQQAVDEEVRLLLALLVALAAAALASMQAMQAAPVRLARETTAAPGLLFLVEEGVAAPVALALLLAGLALVLRLLVQQ